MGELDSIISKNYQGLAFAIIYQAIEDWYKAKFILDTFDERTFKPTKTMTAEEHRYCVREKQKGTIKNVESFIFSKWFETLSGGLNPEMVLASMNETYKNEVFAKRYEDLRGCKNGKL